MKPLVFVIGLKLYCLITLTGSAVTCDDDESFISYVQEFFKPSSLTLIHFTDQDNLVQINRLFNMQDFFSKSKKVMTTTLDLGNVSSINGYSTDLKSLKSERNSLNVFFITLTNDTMKMTDVVNILYPKGKVNLLIIESCDNPVGNPFNLDQGRSLIVKCQEDTTIREWYALSTDEMRVNEIGSWHPETELDLRIKTPMDNERNSLNGKVLRLGKVKTTERFPYHIHHMLDDLRCAGNFTTETVKIVADAGTWDKDKKTSTGGIAMILNDEVDFVESWYEVNPQKPLPVDFTRIVTTTQLCLYLKRPTSRSIGAWSLYIKPFSVEAWIALIWSLFMALIIVTFMRLTVENPEGYGDLFLDNLSNICGIYCQQGLSDFPRSASLRTFYCTMFLFAFAVLSSYSAAFVSYLTVSDVNLPFTSLEKLGEDRSYKLAMFDIFGTYDNIVNATLSPWKEVKRTLLKKNQLPKNIEEAVRMICHEKITLLNNDLFAQLIPMTLHMPCHLVQIPTGIYERFAFILPKKSPYSKAINFYITKMRNTGLHHRYERAKTRLVEKFYFRDEGDQLYYRVTLEDVAPLLVVLLGAAVLSVIIICLENIIFKIYECYANNRTSSRRTSPFIH